MPGRDHEPFDELAVAHVFGGLSDPDAALFRSHLPGCPHCRARVFELRSIAEDLEVAAQQEVARQPVRTQVERRVQPERTPRRRGPRSGLVGALVLAAVVVVMLASSLYLRGQNDALRASRAAAHRTLQVLAEGSVSDVAFADGVTGTVAVLDGDLAFTLSGVPTSDGAWLRVWLFDGADWRGAADLSANDPFVSAWLPFGDAERMVISIEDQLGGASPSARFVADATLTSATPTPGPSPAQSRVSGSSS